MRNKFPIVFFLISIIFISTGCKGKSTAAKPRETGPTVVDVLIASPQPLSNTVEANGTVISNEFVELRPEVSGRLTYLNVPEGKFVQKGTVLARINSADLAAQVQKTKVQLDLAGITEQRLKKLLDVNGINQSDYDAVLNQVNSLKADMAYTQTLIEKTVIRAPFSGTIGLRNVSPGAYVSSANVIATIQQLGKAKIDFTLPEEYSDLIKVGETVDVEIDAANEVREKATILALEPQANTQTRNISVRATLNKSVPNPGAFVKVYVGGDSREKMAIMVPTNTIIPDDRSSQLIVVKEGKAKFVDVKTGLRLAGNIEITQGISAGDSIVVTGVLFARPNTAVSVRGIKTLEELGTGSNDVDSTTNTAKDSTNKVN